MKKLSKIYLLVMVVFLFLFLCNYNVIAVTKTTTDDGQYNYSTVSEDKINLSSSVEYIKNTGYTVRNNNNYNQVNHIFSADMTSAEDVKVATWAIKNSTNTGFTFNVLLDIAKDYEKNNPGWIVLAGVNADQYYMKYGTNVGVDGSHLFYPQSYYPLMSNGENWFSISPYNNCNNVVGFKNDSSLNQMVYGHRTISGFKLNVFDDDGNIINTFPITDLNLFRDLNDGETTVIAPYKESTVDAFNTVTKESNNGFFVIENSDLSYVSNSTEYITSVAGGNVNAFFGKGRISKVSNSVSLTLNQFAIETTNPEIKEALSVGTYVKCEYEFDSGFNGIQEASGFHTVQRLNGQDQNVANSYNSRPYPRSIMGCDSTSGKVYFITCEGKNSAPTAGMYAQESNALMKQYNITDAFQMDGGGSVTSIYRDANGALQYAQPPIESNYRKVCCGLFMVLKVPSVEVEVEDIQANKVVFNLDDSKEAGKYSEMYLQVFENGSSKFYKANDDNKVIIEGLTSKTQYNYVVWLARPGESMFETKIQGSFATTKIIPTFVSAEYQENGEDLVLKLSFDDPDNTIIRMSAVINGKTYNVVFEDGQGTLTLNKNINKILDLDIEIEFVVLQDREELLFEDFMLKADANVYLKHILGTMESVIKDILN